MEEFVSKQIGVTERGDPSLDFSWTKRLLEGNIIITKNLTGDFFTEILKHKDKVILHVSITGYGGSKIEPNIPDYKTMFERIKCLLLLGGFPPENVVIRIDPIFLTDEGIDLALSVFEECKRFKLIKRIRFSFLDRYKHVVNRFKNELEINLYNFSKEEENKRKLDFINKLKELEYDKMFILETCAEGLEFDSGCVSKLDLDILGLSEYNSPKLSGQRPACKCLAYKKELLSTKKRCGYSCLYCYWYD